MTDHPYWIQMSERDRRLPGYQATGPLASKYPRAGPSRPCWAILMRLPYWGRASCRHTALIIPDISSANDFSGSQTGS